MPRVRRLLGQGVRRAGIVAAMWLLATPARAQERPVVLQGGWLFDVHSGEFAPNRGVLIDGGKLLSVTGVTDARQPPDAQVIHLSDQDYVLPGLVDVHAHYNVDLDDTGRRDETVVNPVVFLANGVTSTFPAGEYDPERMLAMRQRIDRGEQVGPRVFNSGPYFGSARPGWDPDATREWIYAEVDRWAERGAAGFKAKGIGPQHLEWLIERAHQHGLPVAGHLGSGGEGSVNAMDAIRMGIDRVEHILGGRQLVAGQPAYPLWNRVSVDSPEFREIVDLYLSRGVFFDPTITAPVYFTELKEGFDYWVDERRFFAPEVQARVRAREPRRLHPMMDSLYWTMRRTTKAFYDAGGRDQLTMGTDLPSRGEFLAGFSAHRELHSLVLAGIPPADVLRIATLNGARALRQGDQLGSIEAGKLADLFVVRGNPLDDIRHTRNVRLVIKAGAVYDPQELLRSVEGRMEQPAPDARTSAR